MKLKDNDYLQYLLALGVCTRDPTYNYIFETRYYAEQARQRLPQYDYTFKAVNIGFGYVLMAADDYEEFRFTKSKGVNRV